MIKAYKFSNDEEFFVAVVQSGEVISFRMMDKDSPNYAARTQSMLNNYPALGSKV